MESEGEKSGSISYLCRRADRGRIYAAVEGSTPAGSRGSTRELVAASGHHAVAAVAGRTRAGGRALAVSVGCVTREG